MKRTNQVGVTIGYEFIISKTNNPEAYLQHTFTSVGVGVYSIHSLFAKNMNMFLNLFQFVQPVLVFIYPLSILMVD